MSGSRWPAPKRILVLTQYYRPEPNFITADVAEHLARNAKVTVVTAHPNYPKGRFYDGTKPWAFRRTVEHGVTVWRVPMIPDHSTSAVRRAVSYLSFAIVALFVAPIVAPRPDVVWVYNTPFTTPLAAIWFRFVTRARIVFTAADLWPESFVASGAVGDGLLIRVAAWYSRTINRLAHDVVCVTEGIVDRYRRDGVAPSRLHMIRVWVEGAPAVAAFASGTREPRIVYAGNLGLAQQIETVIRAAAMLSARGRQVIFDIYGSGVEAERLEALAHELGASSVTFHGTVPPAEAFARSREAMAQVVILRQSPLFAMTVPSKLYFCFAAGAPMLYALEGEAAQLVSSCDGGFAFDPSSPASLCDAIERLMDTTPTDIAAMSAALVEKYNRKFTRTALLASYEEVLGTTAERAVPAHGVHADSPTSLEAR